MTNVTCFEDRIHEESKLEGVQFQGSFIIQDEPPTHRKEPMKRYKKLLVALAAVAAILIVRETGLDQGLVDEVMDAVVETLVYEEELEVPAPE